MKVARVLSDEERHQIARWLGEFIPPAEIPRLARQHFGKKLALGYANHFLATHKWGLLIDRYRQEWLVKIQDVPLAHKKVRLEKLQRMVDRLEAMSAHVQPQQFERRMMALLEKARLE